MHICFFCNEYPPGLHGGLGSVIRTLAHALVSGGQRVSVLGVYPAARAGIEDDGGVRVIRLPHTPLPSTGYVVNGWRLRSALEDLDRMERVDVAEGPELSLAFLSRSGPGFKVVRMHGGHHFFAATLGRRLDPWRQWQERRSFAKADGICAVSRFVAETTTGLLGIRNREVGLLYNPVDTQLFHPIPEAVEVPASILYFGSLCEKKGVRQLLEAMPAIVAAVPHARLTLIGRDTLNPATGGSFQEELQRTIPAGLWSNIEFRGPVPQTHLPRMIAESTVCVLPSHMEAHSVACLEAMAMGKAVVASDIPPFRETINDGETGMLCEITPAAIADCVIRLLVDAKLRAALGSAARWKISTEFSVGVMTEKNISFYERCLRGIRHAA